MVLDPSSAPVWYTVEQDSGPPAAMGMLVQNFSV